MSPGGEKQGRYDTALQSFVHEEERMRKQTKADGDSSFHGGERFDPFQGDRFRYAGVSLENCRVDPEEIIESTV